MATAIPAPAPPAPRPKIRTDKPLVVAVGSANTELIIDVDSLEIGTKGECRSIEPSYGGSALNWAVRLKSLKPNHIGGVTVLGPLGQDERGKQVREFLEKQDIEAYPSNPFGIGPMSAGNHSNTSHSVIIIGNAERTVRTLSGSIAENWARGLPETVSRFIAQVPDNQIIAMIGNIPKQNDEGADAAIITEHTIDAFGKKAAFVYLNPGRARYSLCYHHWEHAFPKIGCIQMNIDEARDFVERSMNCAICRKLVPDLSKGSRKHASLRSLLDFFIRTKMTAVITLAGSGSAAVVQSNPEKVIITWPEEPAEVLDPTGSGDAFGAGVVWAYVNLGGLVSVEDYVKAFTIGSMWGASACEKRGGCNGHPTEAASTKRLGTSAQDLPAIHLEFSKASRLLYMLDNRKF